MKTMIGYFVWGENGSVIFVPDINGTWEVIDTQ